MTIRPFKCLKMFVISIGITFSSCQYDPHSNLYTTTEPKSDDITGTYILDTYHLPQNIVIKHRNVKLELHSDGTFTAVNLPPWEVGEPAGDFFSNLQSGKGKWQKDVLGTLDPGSKKIWGIYLRTDDDRFHPAYFTGDESPYGLIFTLGDPDSGNAIILHKKTQ